MCGKDELMSDIRERERAGADHHDLERASASVAVLRSAIKIALADLHTPPAAGGGPGKAEVRLRAALTVTQDLRGNA
jgi:hypothetical protein